MTNSSGSSGNSDGISGSSSSSGGRGGSSGGSGRTTSGGITGLHSSLVFVSQTLCNFPPNSFGERALRCITGDNPSVTFRYFVEYYNSINTLGKITFVDGTDTRSLQRLNFPFVQVVAITKCANSLREVANAHWHDPTK